MPPKQRQIRIEQKGGLAAMQALQERSDDELKREQKFKAAAVRGARVGRCGGRRLGLRLAQREAVADLGGGGTGEQQAERHGSARDSHGARE